MDRRRFIKTVLSTSLLTPLLARARFVEPDLTLYLISDHPEDYLPEIMVELGAMSSFSSGRFSFLTPHPSENQIKTALTGCGWAYSASPSSTGLNLSFAALHQSARPSFTLVRGRNIMDVRSRRLSRLWKQMDNSGLVSASVTVASFNGPKQPSAQGRTAAISTDGKKRAMLALAKDQTKRFDTPGGEVVVGIEGGRAIVLASTCRHKICQSAPAVSLAGERIICAPNRFLLEIEGHRFVDTVTG